MFEAGVETFGRRRICALRMRVSISPSGSLTIISLSPLSPACLDHARYHPLGGQLPKLIAAHPDLAIVAARAPCDLAAVADARFRRVARQLGELGALLHPIRQRLRGVFRLRLQLGAPVGILGHELAPVVILLN